MIMDGSIIYEIKKSYIKSVNNLMYIIEIIFHKHKIILF
jgi:hypothetical protein